MITVSKIERLWMARKYRTLWNELTAARPETSSRIDPELTRSVAVAAMAVVRLDELSQSHVPLCGKLIRAILAAQERDGGWGGLSSTALCLRALLCGRGAGEAIDRGLAYLGGLQKDDGIWPGMPIRRTDADPYTSAFILFHLGPEEQFRRKVRFDDAVAWFQTHEMAMDLETRQLWEHAAHRCRTLERVAARVLPDAGLALWS